MISFGSIVGYLLVLGFGLFLSSYKKMKREARLGKFVQFAKISNRRIPINSLIYVIYTIIISGCLSLELMNKGKILFSVAIGITGLLTTAIQSFDIHKEKNKALIFEYGIVYDTIEYLLNEEIERMIDENGSIKIYKKKKIVIEISENELIKKVGGSANKEKSFPFMEIGD